ncbi:GNAT family N-acetyltransferase [Agromyces bauzanensis]|uniref:GNAT family N-acetyltransferase n=1 Tax=Agromyces bauzanensis TaxID=1308924 RepID=A0A917PAF8_9MICO|nr:GNAT family N-acetyltransferase [Agromyces bauzanensis]GGJ68284.1 GNAT family N-acetyltransferase [Agromyces bauzanensis]
MNTSSRPPLSALDVGVEPAESADDHERASAIAELINVVYDQAEAGLWTAGARRTDPEEVAGLIRHAELVTARADGRVVGAVRVQRLDDGLAEFGMLAADPERRGLGIGRALVAFAERWAVEHGHSDMQLELLVPTTWTHPSKEFLREWYTRIGYCEVRTGELGELYPELAPLLATTCDLVVYRKGLGAADR